MVRTDLNDDSAVAEPPGSLARNAPVDPLQRETPHTPPESTQAVRGIAPTTNAVTPEASVASGLGPTRLGGRGGLFRRVARMATSRSLPLKGLLSVVDQVIVSGTSFATILLLGRGCPPEELGVYSLAMTIVMLMLNAQAEMVVAPYAVYRHRYRGSDLAKYAGSVAVHQLVFTTLAAACFFGVWVFFSTTGSSAALASACWVLIWAGPLWLCRGFVRFFSFAGFQFVTATVMDATVAALQLGSLFLLVYFDRLTAAATFVVMGAACAVVCLAWLAMRPQPLQFSTAKFLPDWRRNWAFGRWVLASELIGCSTPFFVPWILHHVHGEAVTGVLAACVSMCGLASMFVVGVSHLLTPRAARAFTDEGRDGLQRILRRTAAVYLVATGTFCLLVGVAGSRLMTLLFGAAYADTRLPCTLLALAIMVDSIGVVAGNGLWAISRPKANLVPDACRLVATLATAFCLVGPLGVTGIAMAVLGGSALGTLVRCATLHRLTTELVTSDARDNYRGGATEAMAPRQELESPRG